MAGRGPEADLRVNQRRDREGLAHVLRFPHQRHGRHRVCARRVHRRNLRRAPAVLQRGRASQSPDQVNRLRDRANRQRGQADPWRGRNSLLPARRARVHRRRHVRRFRARGTAHREPGHQASARPVRVRRETDRQLRIARPGPEHDRRAPAPRGGRDRQSCVRQSRGLAPEPDRESHRAGVLLDIVRRVGAPHTIGRPITVRRIGIGDHTIGARAGGGSSPRS
ncbi:hypothetical protein BXY66_0135 [Shimia isoporae]|uniref:Uncharacterized protein n=1 Tax=Shimia isoporae TaxID=647720 RepID=A0A4R1NT31_9RHOB|nr:hypothetical protein BXY66_0135 [Shimia isoporae]